MGQPQRAELFVIKGELLLAMADASAAAGSTGLPSTAEEEAVSTAFATAVSIHPDLPRGWLLWGLFYDRTYRNLLAGKGGTAMEVEGGTGQHSKSAQVAAAAERALTCYLLSLQMTASKGASIMPRVLTLLDAVAGPVAARALGDNADGIPLWQWLPWLPQLLRGLRKGWGPQAQHLLIRIAKAYPQPLYYPLRTYLASTGVGTTSPPDLWKSPETQKPPAAAAAPAPTAAETKPAAAAVAFVAAVAPPAMAGVVAPAALGPPTAVPPPVGHSLSITTAVTKMDSVPDGGAAVATAAGGATVKMELAAPAAAASAADVKMGEAAPLPLPAASPAPARPVDPPPVAPPTFESKGVAARVLSALRSEHPRLASQLDALCDALEANLLPTLPERLLAAVHDALALGLGAEPMPPDAPPPAVLAALKSLDRHFGFSSGAAARASSSDARALAAGWGSSFVRECVSSPPPTLSELLARLDAIRAGLQAELSSRPRTVKLEHLCWRLLLAQQPLVEVPGQYTDDAEPAAETHALIDRLDAEAAVSRDAATGETRRRFTLVDESLRRHTFHLRAPSPLRPHDALGVERLGQLVRLLNRRLLKARETRRRALTLTLPLALRLGHGVMLCASDVSATSLASVLHSSRAAAGLSPHGPALTHQRTLSRGIAPPDDEARRERLRQAFGDACRAVGDDLLLRAVRDALPSAVQQWELTRALTAQLGLHALLCHGLGLRALHPSSLVFSRATGAVALVAFDTATTPAGATGTPPPPPLPFRLTRNLQRLATPFGVEGAFSASLCAAAECFAQQRKCHLELWLAALAAPEEDGATGAPIRFAPPWAAAPALAAARVHELSPAECVKKMGKKADVHANLRALVAEATNEEALARQPPAWQAWL